VEGDGDLEADTARRFDRRCRRSVADTAAVRTAGAAGVVRRQGQVHERRRVRADATVRGQDDT